MAVIILCNLVTRSLPTATATPMPNGMSIRGYTLQKAIGNRLSPVIYGYTDNGWLFRSPDNGASWMLITTRPSVQEFVMSPAEPNVLYSGMGQDCSAVENEIAPMYKSAPASGTWCGQEHSVCFRLCQPLSDHRRWLYLGGTDRWC